MRYLYLFLFMLLANYSLFTQEQQNLPENLGPSINTVYDELLPVISPDGETIYFCRGECPENIGEQDIWYSKMNADGTWSKAINIGKPLNNIYNNFVCSVSPDGNTLLLGNTYNADGTQGKGASISQRTRTGWSFPESIEIKDYYNTNQNANFFLANDGHTLLMAVERKDSYGKRDIYISFLERDGKWTVPKNLGNVVNTSGDEISPFLASDDETLYFSTDGRDGFGNADVYITRRLDDTWMNWSKPENLGPTVNTKGWDAYYRVSAKGDYAYFVSENNSFGKSDIFRVKIPEKARPKPVVMVKGTIVNFKTKVPVKAKIIFDLVPESKMQGVAISNPSTGEYQVALAAGSTYSYYADVSDFLHSNWMIDLKELSKYEVINQNLELIPKSDSIFCIRNVFFKKGATDLSNVAKAEMDKGIDFLAKNNEFIVEVAGYTDSSGTLDKNAKLAADRAENVKNYFKSKGISPDRVLTSSAGFLTPVMNNDTEEGKQLNRRVEFTVRRKNT